MIKPTVTELVGMLDKPALMRWANKQGLLGIDIEKERKRTKQVGTSLHDQIKAREFVDPLHAYNFNRFLADKEIIDCERDIETDWFTGRYDCKLRCQDQVYLIDWKSSRNLYFETRLQLVAYAMAESCDKLGVVCIPEFCLIDPMIRSRQLYEDILICLSHIYSVKWEIEQESKTPCVPW